MKVEEEHMEVEEETVESRRVWMLWIVAKDGVFALNNVAKTGALP